MSKSRQEEIIALLATMCAILAFGFGHPVWGWLFAIKAALDTACVLFYTITEIKSGDMQ